MTTKRENWAGKYRLVTRDARGRFVTSTKWSPVRAEQTARVGRAWKYEVLFDAKGKKTGKSLGRVRTVHYFRRKPKTKTVASLRDKARARLLENARVRGARVRGNVKIHESEELREIDADEIEEDHDEEFESDYATM